MVTPSTEITKAAPQGNIIRTFDDAERAAKAMSASGFFQDSKNAAQAVVKILAGQELGFGAFASMTGVAIIQGKPAVGANLQAAAVKRTGKYNYRVIEMTPDVCELEFYEAGKPVGRSRFDMKDAAAAGLTGKDNWKKFPRNMLFARALSNGVKWFAPDIFNGATVYTPDELGAVEDEDGNVIESTSVVVEETRAGTNGLTEDQKKAYIHNAYRKLVARANAVAVPAPPMQPDWTIEQMKSHYAEIKHFVEDAEQQAAAQS